MQAKAGQLGRGDRLARAQSLEVEVLDHPGVLESAQVDDDLVALLIGVDVVEGEAGVGLEAGASPRRWRRSTSVKRVPRSGFHL